MEHETGWLKSDFLGEDEMRRAGGAALGLQFVILDRENISPDALMLVPEPISRAHSVIAFKNDENVVEIALLDIASLDALGFLKGYKILPRTTDRASILRSLVIYQKLLKEKYGAELARTQTKELFLLHAKANGASYVHIEPTDKGLLVRHRIGGVLYDVMTLPNAAAKEKVILRVPHDANQGFSLPALGLHGEALDRLHRALARGGLILISGKEKSGKTTLLYTLLDHLGSRANIVTVEEQIERRVPRATQTRADRSIGLTPAAAARAALKQDPDVLMVGDLRDEECAKIAAHAANCAIPVLAGLERRAHKTRETAWG